MGGCISKAPASPTKAASPTKVSVSKRSSKFNACELGPDGVYYFGFKKNLEKYYSCSDVVLGKGSYGTVVLGHNLETKEPVAIKQIEKRQMEDDQERRDLQLEVDVMNRIGVGSLNCIWLHDTFENEFMVYMVMEVADGGTLVSRIKRDDYCEEDVANVARCMLRTIAQCHSKHIIHRDIKLENFVYKDKSRNSQLKAIDFGLAVHHPPGAPNLTDTTGTPYFMAPEVIKKNYSYECDVWSAGVLLYLLLTGHRPFPGDRSLQQGREQMYSVLRQIVEQPVVFHPKDWANISPQCRDLVTKLLIKDPAKRIKLEQALQHPWVVGAEAPPQLRSESSRQLDGLVVSRLQRFATYGSFKQMALVTAMRRRLRATVEVDGNSAAGTLQACIDSNPKTAMLCRLFEDMDYEKNRVISVAEAKKGLYESGYDLTDTEVDHLWNIIDVSRSGNVDIDEFLAAVINWQELAMSMDAGGTSHHYADLLREVFDTFDQDKTGLLKLHEVAAVLNCDPDSAAVRAVFMNADTDGDGMIDFDEFKQILSEDQDDSHLGIYDMRLRKDFEAPALPPPAAAAAAAAAADAAAAPAAGNAMRSVKRHAPGLSHRNIPGRSV